MSKAKLSKSIEVLNKLKHAFPKNDLRTIYYRTVHPHLLYGLIIWKTSFKPCLKHIYALQNHTVKLLVEGIKTPRNSQMRTTQNIKIELVVL